MNDRCGCGAWTVAGLRYEASRTVQVRLCLSCWREEPPFFVRPVAVKPAESKRCKRCGDEIPHRRLGYSHCSLACRRASEKATARYACPCGAEFARPASQVRRRRSVYCSRPCFDRYKGVAS